MKMTKQWENIGKGAVRLSLSLESVLTKDESVNALIRKGYAQAVIKSNEKTAKSVTVGEIARLREALEKIAEADILFDDSGKGVLMDASQMRDIARKAIGKDWAERSVKGQVQHA